MSKVKVKTDFFCVGTQKAGTTSLHDMLKQHPDVFLPAIKEVHFFDVDELYQRGLDFYYNYFQDYGSESIVGNINPNLELQEKNFQRIKKAFPEAKIIFIMRDPIKRAYSHYLMSKSRGLEAEKFEDAIALESQRMEKPGKYPSYYSSELGHFEKNHLGYIYRSSYSVTIKNLYNNFDKDQVLFLFFEDLVSKRDEFLAKVCKFIGVQPIQFQEIKSNSAKEAKSKTLSKIIWNPNTGFKMLVKLLMPFKLRLVIKQRLDRLNRKEMGQITLSDEELNKLRMEYFGTEIGEVKKLLNLNEALWGH